MRARGFSSIILQIKSSACANFVGLKSCRWVILINIQIENWKTNQIHVYLWLDKKIFSEIPSNDDTEIRTRLVRGSTGWQFKWSSCIYKHDSIFVMMKKNIYIFETYLQFNLLIDKMHWSRRFRKFQLIRELPECHSPGKISVSCHTTHTALLR